MDIRDKTIELKSYAKINLSLDVKGLRDNGYHDVEMVMQQILLCDDLRVTWRPASAVDKVAGKGLDISITTNRRYLPTDERNLAYKAAELLYKRYSSSCGPGRLTINIRKRIPVAAGLAGGSGNGAAVLHALNQLWNLRLNVQSLCKAGAELGSDVPFCVMGQAAENQCLKDIFKDDPMACHCALATGTGTDLKPLKGLKSHLVLSKPPIGVSTKEVYQGIDSVKIPRRPDNEQLIRGLEENRPDLIKKNMINVLENFTLKKYSIVVYTKNIMREKCNLDTVLMSGSGPTVFGLCRSIEESKSACDIMQRENRDSFWTRTTF